MAFPTTYAAWLTYIRDWIGADEYSDSQIAAFLDLGQVRLNTDLATFYMEKLHHMTILAPDVEEPISLVTEIPDFNKIRLVSVQGVGPLDVAALNEYVEKAQDLTNTDITPQLYNIDAGELFIWPWPAENAVVDIHYYEMVPFLSAVLDTNTFSIRHPDMLLYAASLEASAYMVEDERIPVWEAKYAAGVISNNTSSTKIKMGSTPLKRQITGLS